MFCNVLNTPSLLKKNKITGSKHIFGRPFLKLSQDEPPTLPPGMSLLEPHVVEEALQINSMPGPE